jgi:antitoxin YefM
MTIQTTYTDARAHLASLLDRAAHDREIIIIQRRGAEDVALVAADELTSLLETAYLLRSPANARRLLAALNQALQNEGQTLSLEQLRREVGLDDEAT